MLKILYYWGSVNLANRGSLSYILLSAIIILPERRQHPLPLESTSEHSISTPPLLTIIVPCYNSERTIRQCLHSLVSQRTSVPFDIVAVDSSSDHTPDIIRREFPSIRLIHLERRTLAGAARNYAVRLTPSQYCLMIDSDCIANPDVVERMILRHQESNYAAVAGSLRNGTPRSASGWVCYLIEFKEFMPTAPLRLETMAPTAIICYQTNVFKKHGFFDEDMWPSEDILFNWKITSAGEKILFDPAIEATHCNRTGWRRVLSYQVKLGKFSAMARKRGGLPGAVLLKHPGLIFLMPAVRTFNAVKWTMRYDRKTLAVCIGLLPLYFLAACFWSYGFFRQATQKR